MLIKKGAEASLFLENWCGRKVVMKKRLPKKYRIDVLDRQIRSYRTIHEPQLMHRAKEAGVPTPTIFLVNTRESNIVMEFIEGKQVKQALSEFPMQKRLQLCRHIGRLVGQLHEHGIIHGDLTTSNMILSKDGKIWLIDFGLGEFSAEDETRGVDLHLMQRALQSTHYSYAEECFNAVVEGYREIVGEVSAGNILRKVHEIERRGRYVAERRRDKQ